MDEKKENKFLTSLKNTKFIQFFAGIWNKFKQKHPEIATFLVFFISSNFVTIIQMLFLKEKKIKVKIDNIHLKTSLLVNQII